MLQLITCELAQEFESTNDSRLILLRLNVWVLKQVIIPSDLFEQGYDI